jgi:hypothetical protein
LHARSASHLHPRRAPPFRSARCVGSSSAGPPHATPAALARACSLLLPVRRPCTRRVRHGHPFHASRAQPPEARRRPCQTPRRGRRRDVFVRNRRAPLHPSGNSFHPRGSFPQPRRLNPGRAGREPWPMQIGNSKVFLGRCTGSASRFAREILSPGSGCPPTDAVVWDAWCEQSGRWGASAWLGEGVAGGARPRPPPAFAGQRVEAAAACHRRDAARGPAAPGRRSRSGWG